MENLTTKGIKNIILVGTGMYVSGRGTDQFGTIMPAVYKWSQESGHSCKLHFVGTNSNNNDEIHTKIDKFENAFGHSLTTELYPKSGKKDPKAYIQVLNSVLPEDSVVLIAVPDHVHAEIVEACITRKFHCLVVKPFVPTVDEALTLIDLQKKHGVYGCIEFH